MEHYPEPWEMIAEHKGRNQFIVCGPGSLYADSVIGLVYGREDADCLANGRRIVDCVNALASVPDPSVVGEAIEMLKTINDYLGGGYSLDGLNCIQGLPALLTRLKGT